MVRGAAKAASQEKAAKKAAALKKGGTSNLGKDVKGDWATAAAAREAAKSTKKVKEKKVGTKYSKQLSGANNSKDGKRK